MLCANSQLALFAVAEASDEATNDHHHEANERTNHADHRSTETISTRLETCQD